MKRTLISIALIAASSAALAGGVTTATVSAGTSYQLCDGGPTGGKASVWGGSGAVLADATAAVFTRVGFDVQCSANVLLSAQEASTNLAVVGAGSVKGNQSFKGNTNGGAIATHAKCTNTNDACQASDITSAITQAVSDGGGSGT